MRLFFIFSTILLLVGCSNVPSTTGVVVVKDDFQFLILEDVSQSDVKHVLNRPELVLKHYGDKNFGWVSGYNNKVEVGDEIKVWFDAREGGSIQATSVEVIEPAISE